MKALIILFVIASTFCQAYPICDANGVNQQIGDVSYIEKFGTTPKLTSTEKVRIETHLNYVLEQLVQKPVNHLNQAQRINRASILNTLKQYANAKAYPINTLKPGIRTPIFKDERGAVCAVGHLLQETAGEQVVDEINRSHQFAYVYDIDHPAFAPWRVKYGLTLDECALIQPSYGGPGGGGVVILPPRDRRPRPRPGLFTLKLLSTTANIQLTERASVTQIEQEFQNPTNNQLQGEYIFPIPKEAAIGKFSMFINGKETQGELLDADRARKIYEDIVRRSLDPALLEFHGQALLRMRIFPIQPHSKQVIKIKYTHPIESDNGTTSYVLPLSGSAVGKTGSFSMKADINTATEIKNIYSPTHEIEINRKSENEVTLGYENKGDETQNSLRLFFNTAKNVLGVSVLSHGVAGEDGYLMADINPGYHKNIKTLPKDIAFVLDASGSMAGKKMEQAKGALKFCVANLNKEDRFNIIRFSTEASALYNSLKPNSKEIRNRAHDYIEDLKAIGGTNVEHALAKALEHQGSTKRPYFIVFLSDGKPTIGETKTKALLEKIKSENSSNTRIFTFGIGTNLNTHLLDEITRQTKAYRTYVLPDEDIEIKVSSFFTKISSPIFTDIKIEFDEKWLVQQIQPATIPDLFKGGNINLLARFKKGGNGSLKISGLVHGERKTFNYQIKLDGSNKENEFIAPLWATSTVGYLLDEIRLRGEQPETIKEIVRLSKKFGIITPYTSYLILEDEAQLSMRNNLEPRNQIFQNRMRGAPRMMRESLSSNYGAMNKEAGDASVQASSQAQSLNQVRSIGSAKSRQQETKHIVKGMSNLDQGIKNVRGRAFYQQNHQWVDSNIQKNDKLKQRKVRFNSSEYFTLLNQNNSELAPILSLGSEVRFVFNNQIIEIIPSDS